MERKVLFVDEDEESRKKLEEVVESAEVDITPGFAGDLDEARDRLDGSFHMVVTELGFDEEDLTEFLEGVQERKNTALVGFSDVSWETASGYFEHLTDFIPKDSEDAYDSVRSLLEEYMRSRAEIDYPVPDDEEERLDAIEDIEIEELRGDEGLRRLADIAAKVFDATYSYIGIVTEDTEEYLVYHGAEIETAPRESTICTFTITKDGAMEVKERCKDPRFRFVDELAESGIESYLGTSLETEDGHSIGALCVGDDEPREFTEEEKELLEMFSKEAVEKIRMKVELMRAEG